MICLRSAAVLAASPELTFRGLALTTVRYFAYIDEDGEHWDYANAVTDMAAGPQHDPWRGERESHPKRSELLEFWQALPDGQRAMLTVNCVIELDTILEVDEIGDDFTSLATPHVFVSLPADQAEPFSYVFGKLEPDNRWVGRSISNPEAALRMEKFPAELRKPMLLGH